MRFVFHSEAASPVGAMFLSPFVTFSLMTLCPVLWVPSLKSSQKMLIKKSIKNRISTASWVEFEDSSHTVPPVKGYVVNWLKPWCSYPALVYLNIFLPIYFHLPSLWVLIPCINCFSPPMWLTSSSSFLWLVMFRGRGWGKLGRGRSMSVTGESGYFDTISMGLFFFIVLFDRYPWNLKWHF